MKKILTGAVAVSVLAALAVSSSALYTERQEVTVYRNTPTIDGVINQGEWDFENAIDMNADNCFAWAGEFTCPVFFYYSWDDSGLYCAAQATDPDLCLAPAGGNPYAMDAFQIALDPGGLIGDGQGGGGMFFSIGLMEDGTLGAVYHPYGQGGGDQFDYTGAGRTTDNGWEFEILIPWSSIEILADDGFEWHHGDGTFSNAKICYLDRNDGGAETNAYTVALEGTDAGMDTTAYSYRLNFTTYVAPSLEEPEEPAVDEPTDAPVDDAPVAPTTADAGIVAAAVVMAAAAGVVLSKKH